MQLQDAWQTLQHGMHSSYPSSDGIRMLIVPIDELCRMPGQKEDTGYEAAHQLVIFHTFEHFVAADVNEGDHISVTACGHEVGVVGAPRQIQVGARSGDFCGALA